MSNGHLLIVDDEPSVLASYAQSLTEAGFEVAKASNGSDALRRIESDQFDAILSDVSMPQPGGLALLRRLRARSPDLPVILMLDAPDNGAAIEGTKLGAVQSLVKPIAAKLLAQTASYAVGLCRSRRRVPVTPNGMSAGPEARISTVFEVEPPMANPAIRMLPPVPTWTRAEMLTIRGVVGVYVPAGVAS